METIHAPPINEICYQLFSKRNNNENIMHGFLLNFCYAKGVHHPYCLPEHFQRHIPSLLHRSVAVGQAAP